MEFLKGLTANSSQKKAIAVIIATVLIAGAVYFSGLGSRQVFSPERVMAAGVSLTASDEDSLGIPLDTHFILESDTALEEDEIRQFLQIEPQLELAVEEMDDQGKEFKITPDGSLEPNRVYRFQLGDGAWSFQTRNQFGVTGTLPRDKGQDVPVNSGIEITFTHDNYQDIKEYFEIVPNVEGTFERHKRTAVFVPKGLEPGTIYTVKLRKDLGVSGSSQTLGQDYVFQFETQSPGTAQNRRPPFTVYFSKRMYEYPSGERPLLDFDYYISGKRDGNLSVTVDLYRYRDADQFINSLDKYYRVPYWAAYTKKAYREDASKLEKAASFQPSLQKASYNNFMVFPESLKQGYYLADITCTDNASGEKSSEQIWLQVSDISGYVSVAADKTLVWVNSTEKGGPVEGIGVELYGTGGRLNVGSTDKDGILVFDTPADMKSDSDTEMAYTIVELFASADLGYSHCVLPVFRQNYHYHYGVQSHQDYWNYIHLDRSLYLPNDTVNLWGIIKPMEGSGQNGRLEVELRKPNYYGDRQDMPEILAEEIAMEQDCTFTGRLTIPNLSPGHYELVFRLDGEEITGKRLEVATYTKPAYRIEVRKGKEAVFSDKDSITIDIQATFFEGTPVSSMELSYNDRSGSGMVKTDAKGRAKVTLRPGYKDYSWSPDREYFSVYNRLPEAGEIFVDTSYTVFHNDMNLDSSAGVTEVGAEVAVKLNRITLDAINSGSGQSQNQPDGTPLYIGDPVQGHSITGKIYENRWRKEESGQYYDFINKEVRTNYRYYSDSVFMTDFTITTDAEGKGTFVFPYQEDKSYKIILETVDGMGRIIKRELSLYGRSFVDYEMMHWDYYHLGYPNDEFRYYRTGDEYSLIFKNNKEVLPQDGSKTYLYHTNRKGLKGYKVNTSPYFSDRFEEEDIPNLHVTGVCFDGRTYYRTSPRLIRYEKKERELDITVETHKESYRPGEEVTLDIAVRDADGKPRKAAVNISLVDEAMYMLMDEESGILDGLYSKTLDAGIVTSACSHLYPDIPRGGAEMGEGGGERVDFRDTAFFDTVTTDSKGMASLTLKVPDNLTSWRATFNGVTEDLRAGGGSIPIVVKLPFFTDAVINESYLEGDSPAIAIRSFGDAVTEKDRVRFTVTSPSLFDGERVMEANAFETVYLELPGLKAGSHTVTIKAACGQDLRDILTREIKVYDTYLTKGMTEYCTLKKGMTIKGGKDGLTRLIFTDGSKGMYIQPLYGLYHTYGKRIDQRLAAHYSYNLLKEHFDMDIQKPDEFEADSYQTPDGGISLLPYSDSQADLSVRVAALGVQGFDASALENYFVTVLLENGLTEDDISSALWGLAALDRPVLNQIKQMLSAGDLGVKAKLQLGLALWELGSKNAAREVLVDVLEDNSRIKSPYIMVDSGTDRDDLMELTSLAAVLAARVDAPQAGGMYNYITDNSTKDILVLLEKAMYLSEVLSGAESKPSEFTYTLDGQKMVQKLQPGHSFELLMTPGRLAGLEILQVDGEIGLSSIYNDSFSPEDTQASSDLEITRQYYVNGKPVKEFGQGDMVEIVINYSFSDKSLEGRYQVTDFLPSGLKIIAAPYTRGLRLSNIRYPYEIAGQRISFYLYNNNHKWNTKDPVVYYARVVSKGSFRAQGALIQNMKADTEIKMTGEEKVTIR